MTRHKKVTVKEAIVAARLTTLKGDLSVRGFAAQCGVDHQRMASWLRGANAPGAENLREIARATGASIDWLLGIVESPMYRELTRDRGELTQDVARYIEHELDRRVPLGAVQGQQQRWCVDDGARALDVVINSLEPLARNVQTALQRREDFNDNADMFVDAADALLRVARGKRKDDPNLARLIQRLLLCARSGWNIGIEVLDSALRELPARPDPFVPSGYSPDAAT
jgi:transcriptional regulator with XRE-family HTH domain